MSWTICSKDDVMEWHPIAEADLRDSWSEVVEGLIREYHGSPYIGDPTAIVDEYHNGDDTNTLIPNKPPIVSVQSLSINGLSLQSSDYVVKKTIIQLINQTFPEGVGNVVISYTSGPDAADIPQSDRLGAIAMIIAIANYYGRAGADSSIKMASQRVKEGERTPNVNVGLILHLKAIMHGILKKNKVRAK